MMDSLCAYCGKPVTKEQPWLVVSPEDGRPLPLHDDCAALWRLDHQPLGDFEEEP